MKKFPHLAIRYEDLLFHGEEVSRGLLVTVSGGMLLQFLSLSPRARRGEMVVMRERVVWSRR